MGRYDRQIETVLRVIAKDGQAVQWQQPATDATAPPVDADQPWNATDAPSTQYGVNILFLPTGKGNNAFLAFLTGKDVPTSKLYGLMGAVEAFKPTALDTVYRDGVALAITSIDVLAPNGQIILYTVEFKG